jgi:3',5'-cyclic AMP phosphodiesterase CpdA
MRLAAVSDIHFGSHPSAAEALAEACRRAAPDVLILAGDVASCPGDYPRDYGDLLRPLAPLPCAKLAVAGNHDVWSFGVNPLRTMDIFTRVLEDHGFHVLDTGPVVHGGVGFAGSMAWYDYSFYAPSIGLPREAYWEVKRQLWNDVRYARWGVPDAVVSERLLATLEEHLTEVEGSVEHVVAVTHHMPFREFLVVRDEVNWMLCQAFMGSDALREVLLRHPKVRTAIFGHSHERQSRVVAGIDAHNVAYVAEEPLVVIDLA